MSGRLEVVFMRAAVVAAAVVLALAGLAPAAPARTSGDALILQRITAVYGSSFENLSELVQQMRADGLGWGKIIMILQLALLSGRSVEEIRAMRDGGKGYGEIARELGIHPGELGKAVATVMSDGRSADGLDRAASARERARGRP